MARNRPRPCIDCGATTVGRTRCSPCRRRHERGRTRDVGPDAARHALEQTPEWRRLAAYCRRRDGGCVLRDDPGHRCRGRLEAHHRVPVADGGEPLHEANVVTLCAAGHAAIERGLRLDRRRRDKPRTLGDLLGGAPS